MIDPKQRIRRAIGTLRSYAELDVFRVQLAEHERVNQALHNLSAIANGGADVEYLKLIFGRLCEHTIVLNKDSKERRKVLEILTSLEQQYCPSSLAGKLRARSSKGLAAFKNSCRRICREATEPDMLTLGAFVFGVTFFAMLVAYVFYSVPLAKFIPVNVCTGFSAVGLHAVLQKQRWRRLSELHALLLGLCYVMICAYFIRDNEYVDYWSPMDNTGITKEAESKLFERTYVPEKAQGLSLMSIIALFRRFTHLCYDSPLDHQCTLAWNFTRRSIEIFDDIVPELFRNRHYFPRDKVYSFQTRQIGNNTQVHRHIFEFDRIAAMPTDTAQQKKTQIDHMLVFMVQQATSNLELSQTYKKDGTHILRMMLGFVYHIPDIMTHLKLYFPGNVVITGISYLTWTGRYVFDALYRAGVLSYMQFSTAPVKTILIAENGYVDWCLFDVCSSGTGPAPPLCPVVVLDQPDDADQSHCQSNTYNTEHLDKFAGTFMNGFTCGQGQYSNTSFSDRYCEQKEWGIPRFGRKQTTVGGSGPFEPLKVCDNTFCGYYFPFELFVSLVSGMYAMTLGYSVVYV